MNLLSIALPFALCTPQGANDSVTKFYDLNAATPVLHTDVQERLFPYLVTWYEGSEHYVQSIEHPRDTVAQWIYAALATELEYEGRSFDMLQDGRVRITAPAAVHKDVAVIVAFFEQAMQRSVELRIDFIERADSALPLPAYVPIAEIDKLLGDPTKVRSATVALRPGSDSTVSATRELELVCDYDVEIAHASTVADPIVRAFCVGRRSVWLGSATRGGVQLVGYLSDAAVQGAPTERDIMLGGKVTTESGVHRQATYAKLQQMTVAQHAVVSTLFIPDGQAAVIELGVDLESARLRRAIVVRAVRTGKEPVHTLALSGNRRALQLIDASWATAPRMEFEASSMLDPTLRPRELMRFSGEESVERVRLSIGDLSTTESSLSDGRRDVSSAGPWLFVQSQSESAPVQMAHSIFTSVSVPDTAGLSLTLRRAGRAVASFHAPISSGGSSVFSLGGESLVVRDGDVEVAQSAATIDPVVGVRFDGLLGHWTCARAQDGSWTIALVARAHVLAGAAGIIEAGAELPISIDRGTFDDLSLDERVVLGAQGGPRRITLGGGGELQLEVELR